MPRAATEGLGIDSGWLRLGFAPGMEGSTAARQPGFELQPILNGAKFSNNENEQHRLIP